MLHEVKVIAQPQNIGTSSIIKREAINHIEPFRLSDLMQLLPGGTISKLNFDKPTYFTIRNLDRTREGEAALGVGISIDGVRLSTNTDLQQHSEARSSAQPMNARNGIDTRTIPLDNIESAEIIRGIPSARYGDITSGMVIVHTRKDIRPYLLSVRFTPGIKAFNIQKGWPVHSKGILNLTTGYTRAHSNLTNLQETYHRTMVQASYIHRFSPALYSESDATATISIHNSPQGRGLVEGEYENIKRHNLRFHSGGKWNPQLNGLTSLQWNASVNYSRSVSKDHIFHSSVYSVGTDAAINGEQQGFFIPPQYWQLHRTESCPLTAAFSAEASLHKKIGITALGLEVTTEGNSGQGKTTEYNNPELPSQGGYNFRALPFMHHYAAYAEQKIRTARLSVDAGIRLTGVSVRNHSFKPVIEPRLNATYVLCRKNSGLRLLNVKAGIGLMRKLPTLAYLFNEPDYNNFTSYRYAQSLAVVTTFVSELSGTKSLLLPSNLKAEAGLSGIIGDFFFDITVFHERLRNGFSENQSVNTAVYRRYNTDNSEGLNPEYHDGEVYVNGQPTGYMTDTTFLLSPTAGNELGIHKNGIEFTVRTDYISALATTFVLDGMWSIQRRKVRRIIPESRQQTTNGRSYTMCGFYDLSTTTNVWQRLNTTLRAITEIPKVRLTTTLALETVWLERSQERITDHSSSRYYIKDANGNRVENGLAENSENTVYLDPVFYMDTQGEIHSFTPEMASIPAFQQMVKQYTPGKFLRNSYSPYFMLNLRVTKDIGKHIGITFFANNLAKMNPIRNHRSYGQYNTMNIPASFGAELQIKL